MRVDGPGLRDVRGHGARLEDVGESRDRSDARRRLSTEMSRGPRLEMEGPRRRSRGRGLLRYRPAVVALPPGGPHPGLLPGDHGRGRVHHVSQGRRQRHELLRRLRGPEGRHPDVGDGERSAGRKRVAHGGQRGSEGDHLPGGLVRLRGGGGARGFGVRAPGDGHRRLQEVLRRG